MTSVRCTRALCNAVAYNQQINIKSIRQFLIERIFFSELLSSLRFQPLLLLFRYPSLAFLLYQCIKFRRILILLDMIRIQQSTQYCHSDNDDDGKNQISSTPPRTLNDFDAYDAVPCVFSPVTIYLPLDLWQPAIGMGHLVA